MFSIIEKDLVLQLQTGSLEALGQLYDRYQRMALEQRLMDDQWVVMEWNADSMDWDAWGPAW